MNDEKYEKLISLLDGAYSTVELWEPITPSQIEWKDNWLTDTQNEIGLYRSLNIKKIN